LKGTFPPINDHSNWHEKEPQTYEYNLNIPKVEDFKFIYIGIENQNGEVLHRVDLNKYMPTLKVTFDSVEKPYKWVFWPVNKNDEWVNRLDILL
jgi:hypothetical protein